MFSVEALGYQLDTSCDPEAYYVHSCMKWLLHNFCYLRPLPLSYLDTSLRFHDLHVGLIFCTIFPDLFSDNMPWQPVSHYSVPLASYYPFVPTTLFPVQTYIRKCVRLRVHDRVAFRIHLRQILTCLMLPPGIRDVCQRSKMAKLLN